MSQCAWNFFTFILEEYLFFILCETFILKVHLYFLCNINYKTFIVFRLAVMATEEIKRKNIENGEAKELILLNHLICESF